MAMAVVAAVVAAVGSFASASASASAAKADARAFDRQAAIDTQNAAIAGQQASAEQERVRREGRQAMGAQRAAMAESGTAFTGSNVDVARQSQANVELDALNVQYGGEIERTGLLNQASANRYNAQSARNAAKHANRMRWFGAVGAGLSAYGGAGGKTYMGAQPGKG